MSDFGHERFDRDFNGHCGICGGVNDHHWLENEYGNSDDCDDDYDDYMGGNYSSSSGTRRSNISNYNPSTDPDLPRQKGNFIASFICMWLIIGWISGGCENIPGWMIDILLIITSVLSFVLAMKS